MLSIHALRRDYAAGRRTPADVLEAIFARIDTAAPGPVWITLADREAALRRARTVDVALPLGGVPFAVKDNIDVAGLPTTAACPSFAYEAARSATVVQRLLDAGAVLVGKTNLDQFATGLVGVRSPYGACENTVDARYISGGSSSGSAVAVAQGLCAFALGTDTAGSGRVPAAFNNLVGLKPTRGLLSTSGVVPACRSLDCVSVFTGTVVDATAVLDVAEGFDATDPYSRVAAVGEGAAPWLGSSFRFGVPAEHDLEWFGDADTPALFASAIARLESLGGTCVRIDFTPFREAAALLYAGPWVAERYAAVGAFLETSPPDAHPVVAAIIRQATRYSAVDAFRAAYRLQALRLDAAAQWTHMDVLLLPTAGTIYTRAEVADDPVGLNANLGYYTNFVNLLDLSAVAVPAGVRPDGLPFGISLIAPAFSDRALLMLAAQLRGEPVAASPARGAGGGGGVGGGGGAAAAAGAVPSPPGCVAVAVVGAHLTGQPLNQQLTARGARLAGTFRTAGAYRLFALPRSSPAKPGLLRSPGHSGNGIEVEVWHVPEARFGSFVAGVPPPLAIGSVELADGRWVTGFVCEAWALEGAEEITAFGGWRAWLASRAPV
ncbi:MAG: allophanate hydrolase [Vicinamibacterales bacterium]